jgi:hypothetical protein
MPPTGHPTGTESGSFDIDRLAFGRIHREDPGISALLSGAGVDDSEHLLAPARPVRTRRCPLAASRFDVYGRSVNICPGDQTINDRFLGARRCTCGVQRMALLARDISETQPANLPLSTPEPPLFSFFSGTGLVALALIAATKGAGSPASCSPRWHFSTTLAEQAKGVERWSRGRWQLLSDSAAQCRPCMLLIICVL